MAGIARIGISGWRYPEWRGRFYPKGLVQRDELAYAAERMDSAELNGSFYSLQRPGSYGRWRDAVPDDFVFAVKGGRFITHMLALRNTHAALANFFASGVLALDAKLGPVLWQLPARLRFDAGVLDAFLASLPRTTSAALELARDHDAKVDGRDWLRIDRDRPLRHALEVRHDSFLAPEAVELLRRHDVAMVVADTAGRWPDPREVTSDFMYVRLHGDTELYASGYSDVALERWARDIRHWLAEVGDVYVYFDNDMHVHAPFDAIALREKLREKPGSKLGRDVHGR